MEERIQKVLAGVFTSHQGKFLDEWGPADISEWDSLNHLNLIMALGGEFGFTLEFEEMMAIQTVGDIKKVLAKRGAN